MAVGTVSGVNLDEQWQLIATNTPSAASSSAFSSLSGYKKFWLVYKSVSSSITGQLAIRFNGDSTTGNYAGTAYWYSTYVEAENTMVKLTAIGTTGACGGSVIIDNSLPAVHKVTADASLYVQNSTAIWMPSTPSDITSISFFPSNGGTISGTIYLYGIAA
jgi:hypothetical protein